MKKTVSILSLLVLLLGVWAAALWLSPFNAYNESSKETRYGVNEGLELVEQENAQEGKRYVVEDEDGKELFVIPLRGCLLDTRYRNGQLRFREKNTKREGYIDRQGRIFLNENAGEYKPAEDRKDFANLTGKRRAWQIDHPQEAQNLLEAQAQQEPQDLLHLSNQAGSQVPSRRLISRRWRRAIPFIRKPRKSCRENWQKPMPGAAAPS